MLRKVESEMTQQFFVFTASKPYLRDNHVVIREIVHNTFTENIPNAYSRYYHNDLKALNDGYYLISLSKAPGAKRKFLRSVVEVTSAEFMDMKNLWNDSLTFQLKNNGEVVRIVNGVPVVPTKAAPPVADTASSVLTVNHDFFFVDNATNETYYFANEQRKRNPEKPVNILMIGPSGFGKTTVPQKFAQKVGLDFFRMNCATIRDPEEWFGQRIARDSSTMFVKSLLSKKIEAGNCVIVLDEINRIEPWLTNTLYPLLDDGGGTTVYDGEEIKIGPNVVFVGTMNLGHNYSGIFQIDAALSNRFAYICEVGVLPVEREIDVLSNRTGIVKSDAASIVRIANLIRALNSVECSTRTTLMIATQFANGMTLRSAFQNTVVLRCGNATVRKQVIDIVNALGMFSPTQKIF